MKDFSYEQEFSLPNGHNVTARCRIPLYEGTRAERTPEPLGKGEVELELQRYLSRDGRNLCRTPQLINLVKEKLCCARVAQFLLDHSVGA